MKRAFQIRLTVVGVILIPTVAAYGGPLKDFPTTCTADALPVGAGCMDKYEASVWRIPNPTGTNAGLLKKVWKGKATIPDLTRGGATQLGTASDDYAPCNDQGQNCANDIYSVSLPGVIPAAYITWFQAQEACTNSGKRLPSNAEWQAAANGTPDPGPDNGRTDCNTASTLAVAPTGSRSGCVSARGAFDMVGNLYEWVADWVPRSSTTCPGWGAFSATGDYMCLSGAITTAQGPGALLRGVDFTGGSTAGPLSVVGSDAPSDWFASVGFRCAR